MIRAILYVEIADGAASTIEQLAHLSLGNCLQLVHSFSPNEAVVRLECDSGIASLNQAITDLAALEGVKRITTCVIMS